MSLTSDPEERSVSRTFCLAFSQSFRGLITALSTDRRKGRTRNACSQYREVVRASHVPAEHLRGHDGRERRQFRLCLARSDSDALAP